MGTTGVKKSQIPRTKAQGIGKSQIPKQENPKEPKTQKTKYQKILRRQDGRDETGSV